METIGQRLKRLRETKGLSQGALAKNAGLKSQGAIGNIESGTRGYGESIVDIARVLSTTPDYLRCMTEDPRTVLLMPANTNSVGGGLTVTNAVTDLAQALEVVAAALQHADELTLIQARPLLQRLAEQPHQASQIAPRLLALLDGSPLSTETRDFAKKKQTAE